MRKKGLRSRFEERMKRSEETKDSFGSFKTIFKDSVPAEKFWKCGKGQHLIDIIPYKAGKFDPVAEEGEDTYVLDLWVHQGVGVLDAQYVCPLRNYGKPCPICEEIKRLKSEDDYDEDLVKSLQPKRRVIYNIFCQDNPEEEAKGVQIWEVAHWFAERQFISLARIPAKHGKVEQRMIYFPDPDVGVSIAFSRDGVGATSTSYSGYQFVDREDKEYIKELMKDAFVLDEIIHIPTYEEIERDFKGLEEEEETEDAINIEEAFEGEEQREEEYEEEELESEEDENEKEESVVDERTKRRLERKKKSTKKNKKEEECPFGHIFGDDIDAYDDCDNCPVYDKCEEAYEEKHSS